MGRTAIDHREDAGSTQTFVCALDPCSGSGINSPSLQDRDADSDSGRVPQALGFYTAEAAEESLRAETRYVSQCQIVLKFFEVFLNLPVV